MSGSDLVFCTSVLFKWYYSKRTDVQKTRSDPTPARSRRRSPASAPLTLTSRHLRGGGGNTAALVIAAEVVLVDTKLPGSSRIGKSERYIKAGYTPIGDDPRMGAFRLRTNLIEVIWNETK